MGIISPEPLAGAGGNASIFYLVDNTNTTLNDYRVLNVSSSGNLRLTFRVPDDFATLVKLVVIGNADTGGGGAGKNIDLFSDYATIGEAFNNHSESDVGSTFNTGIVNQFFELDISGVFTSLAAADMGGIFIDHQAIGGGIRYLGLLLEYSK